MSFHRPVGKCYTTINGLGRLQGFKFANGVEQYCGIPYASLPKRWTRSVLKTSWESKFHDGTKLGHSCPHPLFDGDDSNDLVPVPPAPHFPDAPVVDELSGLVMNIVLPNAVVDISSKLPVLVYVHGGSLLYGGANLPIFDGVNLVSHSLTVQHPIICVNFNYRVGLGGFLASSKIRAELEKDGYQGCGNFGFTDQQVAFEWVQRYIGYLGGDPSNVAAVGESAGGISISNQLAAAYPPIFKRAVCMSGLSVAIPAQNLDWHEKMFEATCRYFNLDPKQDDVLDMLRRIPQQELANATPAIQGVPSGTGNPCLDGWFYKTDPRRMQPPPDWLESYMFGDVYHEGVIFHINIMDKSFDDIRKKLLQHMESEASVDAILNEYNIAGHLDHDTLIRCVEHMCGDAIFKIPNHYLKRLCSRLADNQKLHTYHFEQRSRLRNTFEGTAYHAHELLYLFGNLYNEFNETEIAMSRDFMLAWIRFVYGEHPWQCSAGRWKVWGPECRQVILDPVDDENVRMYSRMDRILLMDDGRMWQKWLIGVDALVNNR